MSMPGQITIQVFTTILPIDHYIQFCLFGLVFSSQSTVMVMSGQSVHLTPPFFLGNLDLAVNQYFVHILSLVTDNNPS